MAKEPSQFEMKKQFNLPENAVFLGWVIHHPENDEYVVTYTSNEYMANIGWGLSPEKAKKFKTLKKANSVISDLEIGDKWGLKSNGTKTYAKTIHPVPMGVSAVGVALS